MHNEEMNPAARPSADDPTVVVDMGVLPLEPPQDPTPAAPTARRKTRRMVGRRHMVAAAGVALAVAIAAFGATALMHGTGKPARPSGSAAVLHPDDGSLTVGSAAVPQLSGTCHGSQCQFPAAANLPTVTAPAGTLTLRAGKSTVFPGVSAFNVEHPSAPAPITAGPGELRFASAAPGSYRVTLVGNKGGTWQFTLVVTAATVTR